MRKSKKNVALAAMVLASLFACGGQVWAKDSNIIIDDFKPQTHSEAIDTVKQGDWAEAAYRGTAVGWGSKAHGEYSTALGTVTNAEGRGSTAIGDNAKAYGYWAAALGGYANVNGDYSVAVGPYAFTGFVDGGSSAGTKKGEGTVQANYATAIGAGSAANRDYSIAVGYCASVGSGEGMAAATDLQDGYQSIAIGSMSSAHGYANVAIGYQSKTNGDRALSLGNESKVYSSRSVAIGYNAIVASSNERTSGLNTDPLDETVASVAIGDSTEVASEWSVAIGTEAVVEKNSVNAVAIGAQSQAKGAFATAVGNQAKATNGSSVALGGHSTATGSVDYEEGETGAGYGWATAVGDQTHAYGTYSTAIGASADATRGKSTALGYAAQATNRLATALGASSNASGLNSTAVGEEASAVKTNNTAVGHVAKAYGYNSSAYGDDAKAYSDFSTAIGARAQAGKEGVSVRTDDYVSTEEDKDKTYGDLAIGDMATATGGYWASAIGGYAKALGHGSLAFGYNAQSDETSDWSVVIGRLAKAADDADYSAAIGHEAEIHSKYGAAIGFQAKVNKSADYSTAIGYKAEVKEGATGSFAAGQESYTNGTYSTSVGYQTKTEATQTTALGYKSTASKTDATAVGSTNTASGERSAAYGYNNTAAGNDSVAIGSGSSTASAATGSVAIGKGAIANVASSVALGSDSVVNASDGNVVSVGKTGSTRKIINVTDGTNNTDAATYGQVITGKSVTIDAAGSGAVNQNGGTTAITFSTVSGTVANNTTSGEGGSWVKGQTVYLEVRPTDGGYVKNTQTTAVNLGKLDTRIVEYDNHFNWDDDKHDIWGGWTVSGSKDVAYTASSYSYTTRLGYDDTVSGAYATAIGYKSKAAVKATAVGYQSEATKDESTAVGSAAKATGTNASAYGKTSEAQGKNSTAVGSTNYAYTDNSTAIGYNNKSGVSGSTTVLNTTAVGSGNTASGERSAAYGYNNKAAGNDSVAIGSGSNTASAASESVAIGKSASAKATEAIAIGTSATASDEGTIAIGQNASASLPAPDGSYSTEKYTNVKNAVAIGNGATVGSANSVAIGASSVVKAADENVVSVGYYVSKTNNLYRRVINVADGQNEHDAANYGQIAKENQTLTFNGKNKERTLATNAGNKIATITIETADTIDGSSTGFVTGSQLYNYMQNQTGGIVKYNSEYLSDSDHWLSTEFDESELYPDYVQEHGENSAAYGYRATASGDESVALGANATASAEGSVAIGSGSVANKAKTVSFGSSGNERKLTNVADGIAITDAATVGQIAKEGQTIYATDEVISEGSDKTKNVIYDNAGTALATMSIGSVTSGSKGFVSGGQVFNALPKYQKYKVEYNPTTNKGSVTIETNGGGTSFIIEGIERTTTTSEGGTSTGGIEYSGSETIDIDNSNVISAHTADAVTNDATKDGLVKSSTLYNELRPETGAYVKDGNTTAQNLAALDDQVAQNAGDITNIQTAIDNQNDLVSLNERTITVGGGESEKISKANTVDIGGTAGTRTLTGLKAGTELTDAVNVGQLENTIEEKLSDVTYYGDETTIHKGEDNTFSAVTASSVTNDSVEGKKLVTSETVYGETHTDSGSTVKSDNTAGENLYALDEKIGSIDDNKAHIVSNDNSVSENLQLLGDKIAENQDLIRQDGNGTINIGNTLNGDTVNVSGAEGDRVISGVKDGTENTDAANYGQIAMENQTVNLSGEARDAADDKKGNKNQIMTNNGEAIATFTNMKSVSSDDYGFVAGKDLWKETRADVSGTYVKHGNTTGQNLSALDDAVVDIEKDMAAQQGLISQSGDTINIGGGDGVTADTVSIAGKDGETRTLTGISEGKNGTDAVNVKQLKDTIDKTATYYGDEKTIHKDGYTFSAKIAGSIAADDNGLVDAATLYKENRLKENGDNVKAGASAAENIEALDDVIGDMANITNSGNLDGNKSIAENLSALDDAITAASGLINESGKDGQDGQAGQDGKVIEIGKDSTADTIDVSGKDGESGEDGVDRVITGVADGSESNDAATFGQIAKKGQAVKLSTVAREDKSLQNTIVSNDGVVIAEFTRVSQEENADWAEDYGFVAGADLYKYSKPVLAEGEDEAEGATEFYTVSETATTGENLGKIDQKIGTFNESTGAEGYAGVLDKDASILANLEKLDTAIQSSSDIVDNGDQIRFAPNSGTEVINVAGKDGAAGADGKTIERVITGAAEGSEDGDVATWNQIAAKDQTIFASDSTSLRSTEGRNYSTAGNVLYDNEGHVLATMQLGSVSSGSNGFVSGGQVWNNDIAYDEYEVTYENGVGTVTVKRNNQSDAFKIKNILAQSESGESTTDLYSGDNETISVDNATRKISAKTADSIQDGNTHLVTSDLVYDEVRPTENGTYVNNGQTTGENLKALDTQVKTNSDAIDGINTQLEGTSKLISQEGNTIHVGGGDGVTADTVSIAGKDGETRTLTGLSEGKNGTDAVNVDQLNKTIKKQIADTATYEGDETTIHKDGYTFSAKLAKGITADDKGLVDAATLYKENRLTDDGDNVKADASAAENIKALDTVIGDMSSITKTDDGSTYSGNLDGDKTIADNLANLDKAITTANSLVKDGADGKDGKDGVIEIGKDSTSGTIDVSGKDGKDGKDGVDRIITGVADGEKSNDAATFGQIAKEGQTVNLGNTTAGDGQTNVIKTNDGETIATFEKMASVSADDTGFVSGADLYNELRTGVDGDVISKDKTTGENLKALDTAVSENKDKVDTLTDKMETTEKLINQDGNTINIGGDTYGDTINVGNPDGTTRVIEGVSDGTKTGDAASWDQIAAKDQFVYASKELRTAGEGKYENVIYDNAGNPLVTMQIGEVADSSKGFVSGGQVWDALVNNDTYTVDYDEGTDGKITGTVVVKKNDGSTAFTINGIRTEIGEGEADEFIPYTGDEDTVQILDNNKITAVTTDKITEGGKNLVTAGTIYDEVRPTENGTYVNNGQTTGENLKALDTQVKTNSDAIDGINTQLEGTSKLISQEGNTIHVGGGDGVTADTVSIAGKDGETRTLTGISEGKNGTDAVNVNQLNDSIEKQIADTATYYGDEETIHKDGYTFSAKIAEEITADGKGLVDAATLYKENRLTEDGDNVTAGASVAENLKALDTAIGDMSSLTKTEDGSTYSGNLSGDKSIAENLSALDSAITTASGLIKESGKDGSDGSDGKDGKDGVIEIGKDSTAGTIDVSGKDGEDGEDGKDGVDRVITGVADGSQSNDAATFGQIAATKQTVNLGNTTAGADGQTNVIKTNDGETIATFEKMAKVSAKDTGFVSGADLYNELRTGADGDVISKDKTTGENLAALDTAVSENKDKVDTLTDKMETTEKLINQDGNTINIGGNTYGDTINVANPDGTERVIEGVSDGTKAGDAATWDQIAKANQFVYATSEKDASDNHRKNVIYDNAGNALVTMQIGSVSPGSNGFVSGGQVYESLVKNDNYKVSYVTGTDGKKSGSVTVYKNNGDVAFTINGIKAEVGESGESGDESGDVTTSAYKGDNKTIKIDGDTISAKTGDVSEGSETLVTGGQVYNELRPTEDGDYVKKGQTTGENLKALDTQVSENKDNLDTLTKQMETTEKLINQEGNTINVGGDSTATTINVANPNGTERVIEGVADGTKAGDAATWDQIAAENQTVTLANTKAGDEGRTNVIKANDGSTIATFTRVGDDESVSLDKDYGFVAGADLYNEVRPVAEDGETVYNVSADKTTGENLKALDTAIGDMSSLTKTEDGSTYSGNLDGEKSIAENLSALDDAITTASGLIKESGKDGSDGSDGKDGKDGVIEIGKDSTAGTIDVSGKDGEDGEDGKDGVDRVITGVADGSQSNDAATFGQIAATKQTVNLGNTTAGADGQTNVIKTNDGETIATFEKMAKVSAKDTGFVSGSDLYKELRADADGDIVKADATTGENLSALDTQVSENKDKLETLTEKMGTTENLINQDGNTINIGGNTYGDTINVANPDGTERVIEGVADGTKSGDAASWDQIAASNQFIYATTDTMDGDSTKQKNIIYDNAGNALATMQIGTISKGSNGFVSGGVVYESLVKNDTYTVKYEEGLNGKTTGTVVVKKNDGTTAFTINGIKTEVGEGEAEDFVPYTGDNETIQISDKEGSKNKISVIKGEIKEGSTGVMTGGQVYDELHVKEDGEYVKGSQTTADNIKALDTQVAQNTSKLDTIQTQLDGQTNLIKQEGKTIKIGGGEDSTADIVTIQKTDGTDRTLTGIADGEKDNDAVNKGQLDKAISEVKDMATYVGDDETISVDKVDGKNVISAMTDDTIKKGGTGLVTSGTVYEAIQDMGGISTKGDGEGSTQIGDDTKTKGDGSTGIGNNNTVEGENSTATGSENIVKGDESQAYGYKNEIYGKDGKDGEDGAKNSTATGSNNTITGDTINVYGYKNTASGEGSNTYGNNNNVTGENSGAFGNNNTVSGDSSYAVGNTNTISGGNSYALGDNTTVSGSNSVALGSGSVAAEDNVVSVGSEGGERRITNVAAGVNDTDAVNMGQLKNTYYSVRDELKTDINKVGAGAAALAALRPEGFDPTDKLSFAVGMGRYKSEYAGAFGVFYKPNQDMTVSFGSTVGNGNTMMNLGFSFKIGSRGKGAGIYSSGAQMAREVNSLRADNERLKADKEEQAGKIQALEADNAAMKEQIAQILAKLEMSEHVEKSAVVH